jgi:hypothetical protein
LTSTIDGISGGFPREPLSRPNRKKTSEQVTKIEMAIKKMMIQVISSKLAGKIYWHSLTRHLFVGNGIA